MLRHLHRLWGFDVHRESLQGEQRVAVHHMPPQARTRERRPPRPDRPPGLRARNPSARDSAAARYPLRDPPIARRTSHADLQGGRRGARPPARPPGHGYRLGGGRRQRRSTCIAQGFRPVGADFPVFLHPRAARSTPWRAPSARAGAGYGGFTFYASPEVTLEEDLIRRDLTINAMAEDATAGSSTPTAASTISRAPAAPRLAGLRRGPAARAARRPFRRALRAAGLSRRRGNPGADGQIAASGELADLTAERVWKEIERALMEPRPEVFIQVLRDCGALEQLLPELQALFGVPQPAQHHPEIDSGEHVLMVLRQCAEHDQPLPVRWACLLHDLGKGRAPTRPNGRATSPTRAAACA